MTLAALTAFATLPALAQSESPWGAQPGTDPCTAEGRLEQALADDPGLAARRELFEALVREAQRKGLVPTRAMVAGPSYVIPIVVHIVHQNGAENISDLQVQSQIYALNRDFANSPGGPIPAVDTGIQFCLASQLPPASPVVWSTTPGITRTVSPETFHTYGVPASEVALKAIDYLPSTKYLNVWVVNNIAGGGGGVAGYATFPGAVPAALDGIVIRYTCFGSNGTPYGGPYPALLPTNNFGKIMTHEVGHWLNLLHTFHGGCTVPGDQVSDTPPEAVNRTGCPTTSLQSCTAVNDPIENFMDYTNDVCRFAYTAGQRTRMQTALSYFRSTLVSAQNLIDVGCPSGLNALILASRGQICAPDNITFTTPAAGGGYTYAWSFPGGSPSSASTQTATTNYAAPGVYPATLTVTDGGSNSSTNSLTIYARACTPITGPCTNWVLPNSAGFNWSTGTPVPVTGRNVVGAEPASAVSDGFGLMRFYADGNKAVTNTNIAMPNGTGLLAGGSSHNGVLIVPRPGNPNQYFLLTMRQWEDGATANPMNYSVVDMTLNGGLGDIVAGQKNLLVSLPASPNEMVEGVAAIPHCNGVDWWLITNGANTGSGKLFVTLVTSAGPVSSTAYPIGLPVPGTGLGAVTPSSDGTRVAVVSATAGIYPNHGMIGVYNFNRSTGVPTILLAPTNTWRGYSDICFSPNGKLVYFNNNFANIPTVKQLDLATLQSRDLLSGPWTAIKQGPDGLVYISQASATSLHCINYPNNFNTANLNECGLNLSSVPMPAGTSCGIFGSLPNMPLQCTTIQPADFSFTVTNCLTVNFTSLNCAGPWSWTYGDAGTGSGQSVSHTYAAAGTYTVTLTVPGASPSVKTVSITLGLQPVSIAGPNTHCGNPVLTNYTAVGPAGYTYTWAVTGGLPASGSGNNIDITWGPGTGTATLTVLDPVTGCTATVVKNVGTCPSCTPPPANMVAWYPLDEVSGPTALEIVLGAHGSDVSTPLHASGKVQRCRTFSGASQYVQANDAPNLNFGAGDFTVDAWVRTTTATGIAPIVDKRFTDPEVGYALYLKNGRLALRLGDGVLADGTEYWSGTSPLVADGQWHHVAGVLRRSAPTNGTRLYVDGVVVGIFPAYGGLSVTNVEKLLIGAQKGYSGPVGYLNGSVDEVELFQRSLNAAEISAIYASDVLGKCKEFSWVPTTATICRDQVEVTLTMQVCNYTGTPQSYNVSFAGLPPGGTCTWNGPTGFTQITPNPVVVPANGCVPVVYKVARPTGMPLYATSCYQATVTNIASSSVTTNIGSLYASRRWCNLIIGGPVSTGGGSGGTARVSFQVTNTGGVPTTDAYSVRIQPRADSNPAEEPLVTLNGLPPGDAVHGDLVLGPDESALIAVDAGFLEPRAFRFYDVVLSLDEDGDGIAEDVATGGVTFGPSTSIVGVPPVDPLPGTLSLGITPNPVRSNATIHYTLPSKGRVELALFDVAGRQVRSVPSFYAEAGNGALTLNCRGLSRGVYFVRLRVNGNAAGQRFLMLE